MLLKSRGKGIQVCQTKLLTAAMLVCSFARVLLTCRDLCCDWPKNNKHSRPRLFKRWIALSTGKITIQWISIGKTDCTIQWIKIYISAGWRFPPFEQLGPGWSISTVFRVWQPKSYLFQQNIQISENMSSPSYFSSFPIIDVLGKQQKDKIYILTGFYHLFDLFVRDNAWPYGYAKNLKVICRFEVTG